MVIKKFRRKSVFPRGNSRLSIGNVQQFQWLDGIIKTVIVLNLIDALFTLFWAHAGLAKEANIVLCCMDFDGYTASLKEVLSSSEMGEIIRGSGRRARKKFTGSLGSGLFFSIHTF